MDAFNYATSLVQLKRYEEAKSLLRESMSVARRILGASHDHTLRMRTMYASALFLDSAATLDDLREAVDTCEETERIARRVLGGAHPVTEIAVRSLECSREALSAAEACLSNP